MHQCFLSDSILQELGCAPTLRERFFCSFKNVIIPSCWQLGSNFLLYQLLDLCIWKLRINCWMKSSPPVRIIFKHYLFSLSLGTWLNLRPPVELGTVYWPVFILVKFFCEQLQIHYQPQWICEARIYHAVQNVFCVILHIPPHCPCVKCLSNCFISRQIYLLAWFGTSAIGLWHYWNFCQFTIYPCLCCSSQLQSLRVASINHSNQRNGNSRYRNT